MKTNLEELNYRFIKELLNDKSFKNFSIENAELQAQLQKSDSDFNYDAWCKGLFKSSKKDPITKTSNKETLIGHLEILYWDEGIEFDKDIWDKKYIKGSPIDLINVKELKDRVTDLWWQQIQQDVNHDIMCLHWEINELKEANSNLKKELDLLKNKK